jgi:hypothetical protein
MKSLISIQKGHESPLTAEQLEAVREIAHPVESVPFRVGISVPDAVAEVDAAVRRHTRDHMRDIVVAFRADGARDYIEHSSPLHRVKNKESAFIGQLILQYPEVAWVLQSREDNADPAALLDASHNALFDPQGIRNIVKANIRKDEPQTHASERSQLAAIVEDERSYSMFHAYTAYRAGYRCEIIDSYASLSRLRSNNARFAFTFEDVFLNLADRGDVHLSQLEERDTRYPALAKTPQRVFVTAGTLHTMTAQNEKYRETLEGKGVDAKIVYKPTAGLFDLIAKAGLKEKFKERREAEWSTEQSTKHSPTHSAPGAVLEIAESLLRRAKEIQHDAKDVADTIHAAMLALEALELLNYRTPATSLDAIALRHALEVEAECMFYGVEYGIRVVDRLSEIEHEVAAAARWFNPTVRDGAALNARMSIVTSILRVFREYGHFDEEQLCLKHLRKLYRQWLSSKKKGWPIVAALRAYLDTLVGSMRWFLVAIVCWPLAVALVASLFRLHLFDRSTAPVFESNIYGALVSFFGLQPASDSLSRGAMWLTVLLILMGFAHLGIFVAHCYTVLSRR